MCPLCCDVSKFKFWPHFNCDTVSVWLVFVGQQKGHLAWKKTSSSIPKGFFEHWCCQASVEAAQHPLYQKSDGRSVRIEVSGWFLGWFEIVIFSCGIHCLLSSFCCFDPAGWVTEGQRACRILRITLSTNVFAQKKWMNKISEVGG